MSNTEILTITVSSIGGLVGFFELIGKFTTNLLCDIKRGNQPGQYIYTIKNNSKFSIMIYELKLDSKSFPYEFDTLNQISFPLKLISSKEISFEIYFTKGNWSVPSNSEIRYKTPFLLWKKTLKQVL